MAMMKCSGMFATAVLVAGIGCNIIAPCTQRTRIVEITSSLASLVILHYAQVNRYRQEGWDCSSESIRNAFGGWIGTKYTCTICD